MLSILPPNFRKSFQFNNAYIKYVAVFFIIFALSPKGNAQIHIDIKGMKSYDGELVICVYDVDTYLKQAEALTVTKVSARTNTAEYDLKSLPKEYYAIVIYQDLNMNNILDLDRKGRPKEPVAFSNGAKWNKKEKTMPTWDETNFAYRGDPLDFVFKIAKQK